jgi:PAS domain S-box-containing protein
MLKPINLTKRYVIALSLIAILSALAYVNLNQLISSQADNGKQISLSSRQKILAQKIAFFAIYYKIKQLETVTRQMRQTHEQLIQATMSDDLRRLYFEAPVHLDRQVQTYLGHAEKFATNRNGTSLTYLLNHSNPLMEDLGKAADLYLHESDRNTRRLKQVELLIFVTTLVTLFFEALLIFMPANRRIKQYTREIIAQKDYSDAVIETSTNAIIALDPKLQIQTYNQMAETIFGFTKSEMLHRSRFGEILPREYHLLKAEGLERFLASLDIHEDGTVIELEAHHKHNGSFPVRIAFGVPRDQDNIALVANIQDISRERLNDQILQQQAKFAALGEMIAIIAHQWRQPLSELNFNCIYIRKKLRTGHHDPDVVDVVNKNEGIIQFMSETITNFQNFYRTSKQTHFNPTVSIDQVTNIIQSVLDLNGIVFHKTIDSEITIYGNPNALAQVILSILQNIIDIVRNKQLAHARIDLSLYDTDTDIILRIRDNVGGIQIDPIDDIFKPFKSKKKTPSTGIGLYMSKRIIETKFNGRIHARNLDEGAEFTIMLPH